MALHSRKKKHATRNRPPPEEPAFSPPQAARASPPRRRFSVGTVWRFLTAAVRYALVGAMALLCAGIFFVAVIMGEAPELGQDKADSTVVAEPAPLPGAGEFASQDLAVLASYFPGSLARLDAGSGLTLQQGTVQDMEVDGVACRVVSLRYQVGQDAVTLRSASPAGYLSRYGTADVVLSSEPVMLGTLPGVSLRTASLQAVMARKGDLLYVLEAPLGFPQLEQLSAWVVFE